MGEKQCSLHSVDFSGRKERARFDIGRKRGSGSGGGGGGDGRNIIIIGRSAALMINAPEEVFFVLVFLCATCLALQENVLAAALSDYPHDPT